MTQQFMLALQVKVCTIAQSHDVLNFSGNMDGAALSHPGETPRGRQALQNTSSTGPQLGFFHPPPRIR
jgi:hypothetical protein